MGFALHTLPDTATTDEVIALVAKLNADGKVNGIMVQEPLPRGIDEDEVKATIRAAKDADGVSPINAGRLAQAAPIRAGEPGVMDYLVPATPLGGLEMLLRAGVEISGKRAVVVGRSNIVGRPMATILSQKEPWANATVTVPHSRSDDLAGICRLADLLIVAVGRPDSVTGDMVKDGAVVIDVGVNRVDDPNAQKGYRLVGDVAFDEAKEKASWITPVPGGVGPMTIAMLLQNTVTAAGRSAGMS